MPTYCVYSAAVSSIEEAQNEMTLSLVFVNILYNPSPKYQPALRSRKKNNPKELMHEGRRT